MEGVVILHETVHELHTKKMDGIIFKIDFEKAYDKVKWQFLQQTLRMKGFSQSWCNWISNWVEGGTVSVKVNDNVGKNFRTCKGLRQGDPMSPILFNIVADMLAILIERAKADGQIRGVIPHLVDDGLSILQYADDTIIFLEHDFEQAKNMKAILCVFEHLSGLKINFHRSEIFCFGGAKEMEDQYRQLFGCNSGSFPFKYLGIPIHYRKLRNSDWKCVEDRFQRKLSTWKGKNNSYGGRLVLLNSVLSSLPMFMLSFFEIPRGVLQRLDYYRSSFFWSSDSQKKKYRLTKWDYICRPKDQGGLGVLNLDIMNRCLLSKWLFKLLNGDGLWQNLLRNKYLKSKPLSHMSHKPGTSQFWAGLMKVKDQFFQYGSFKPGNGMEIRFWEDTWLGLQPLKYQYPSLYNVVRKRHSTLAEVMSTTPLNVSFRRSIVGPKLVEWNDLISRLANITLSNEKDCFIWSLHKNGHFSVKSMYNAIINSNVRIHKRILWEVKVPLKIKVFMWFLQKK